MGRRCSVPLAALAALAVLAVPVGAHTEVRTADPAPASEVAGPVDSVTLTFLSEIRPGGTIDLEGPDGPIILDAPTALSADALTMEVTFDPVDVVGDYVVRYSFVAADGDAQSEGYRFRIVATADEDGASPPVGAAVAAAGLVVALAVVVGKRRRHGTES